MGQCGGGWRLAPALFTCFFCGGGFMFLGYLLYVVVLGPRAYFIFTLLQVILKIVTFPTLHNDVMVGI